MNPPQGGANGGGFNPAGGQNGQMNQGNLQQQLVAQLSAQLSQTMSQKFPQANILSALANVQSQMQQNPQQQQQQQQPPPMQQHPAPLPPPQQQQMAPDLLALARSGNLAGLLAANNAGMPPAGVPNAPPTSAPQLQQPPAPPPPQQQQQQQQQNSATAPQQQNGDVRQRLLQQLSKTAPPIPTSAPKDPPPPTVCQPVGHVGGEVRAGFQGHPSSSMTVDAVKDERRKAPGSVIVPCRARGMPMEHNFKTAYFVIPENVRHGEELICSYFACRNAGVKFRYCSHCKVPVAKRNFRKRHKHGDNMGKDGGDDDEQSGTEEDGCSDEGEGTEVPSSRGVVPSQVTTGRSSSRKEAIPSQVTTTASEERVSKKNRSEERSKKSHIPSQVTTSGSSGKKDKSSKKSSGSKSKGESSGGRDSRAVCMRSGDDRAKVIDSRRKRWAYLLEKRPQTKDGEAMSSWLMQVLAVSDLWKPLNESEKLPDASLDLIREMSRSGSEKKKKKKDGQRSDRTSSRKEPPGYNDAQTASSKNATTTNNNNNNNKQLPEKQGTESLSNDSDTVENVAEGRTNKQEEDRTSNKKRSSLLLKKRPVVTTENNEDDEDKGEPPLSKVKRENGR